ncbi:MAG TPA: hypothetical protein VKA41_07145 [Solirubrobacterales bacterium]|nr:hypothetical protein [Solirubrobacterales bacterium]
MHLEAVALLELVRQEEAAEQGDRADDQQAAGEDREDGAVEVVTEPAFEVVEEPDARDRRGDAPGGHPPGERHVHGLQLQVAPAPGGLGDRRVEDVGADRGGGLDPEDQDQERRHQRSTAHAGKSDQEADADAEEDDRWIHGVLPWGGRLVDEAFPTLFPFMTETVLKGSRHHSGHRLFPLIGRFSRAAGC